MNWRKHCQSASYPRSRESWGPIQHGQACVHIQKFQSPPAHHFGIGPSHDAKVGQLYQPVDPLGGTIVQEPPSTPNGPSPTLLGPTLGLTLVHRPVCKPSRVDFPKFTPLIRKILLEESWEPTMLEKYRIQFQIPPQLPTPTLAQLPPL